MHSTVRQTDRSTEATHKSYFLKYVLLASLFQTKCRLTGTDSEVLTGRRQHIL